MKVTLREIYNGKEALERLIVLKTPFKTSYRLARLTAEIGKELELLVEKRNDLIKELGTENEKGELWIDKDDHSTLEKFNKSLNEAMDLEIELKTKKFSPEDFGTVEIQPTELIMLEFMMDMGD